MKKLALFLTTAFIAGNGFCMNAGGDADDKHFQLGTSVVMKNQDQEEDDSGYDSGYESDYIFEEDYTEEKENEEAIRLEELRIPEKQQNDMLKEIEEREDAEKELRKQAEDLKRIREENVQNKRLRKAAANDPVEDIVTAGSIACVAKFPKYIFLSMLYEWLAPKEEIKIYTAVGDSSDNSFS